MIRTMPFCSVIVPARNASGLLPKSLGAICESDLPREHWELIVVDDGSSDDTAAVAARYADTVVRLPGRANGPAYARNRGFEVSRGSLVVFFDADVVVHRDTLRRFAEVLTEHEDVGAVFGSYDDQPAATGFMSQYRNLLHHHVHQQNPGDSETFWAGAGAIRRQVFEESGMYDEWHYRRPQIEDIELGGRIRAYGWRILLRPEIQAKHLKRWTFMNVLNTDIKDRGIPWARLLAQRGTALVGGSLNLSVTERVNTVAVWLALLIVLTAPFFQPAILALAGACVGVVLFNSRRLFAFFYRARGPLFASGVLPVHLLYYILNGISFGIGLFLHQLVGAPKQDPLIEAYAEVGLERWPPVPARRESTWTNPVMNEDELRATIAIAFARVHKAAFGIAIGVAGALVMGVATLMVLVSPTARNFPLGLLGHYFAGYSVSWTGMAIGMAWAFAVSFVGGWFLAFTRNFLLGLMAFTIRTRAEMQQSRTFLDHI